MQFNKNYSQESVDCYVTSVESALNEQEKCTCGTSCSTWADIHGRPICNQCGGPIQTQPRTITIPYWFYEQK